MAPDKAMWVERARTLAFSLLALLVAASIGVLLAAEPAHAKTFRVNSTGDRVDNNRGDGSCFTGRRIPVAFAPDPQECTLRAAIQEANAAPGPHTINFNVLLNSATNDCDATTKVCTISPGSFLGINKAVTIDGYTQNGATENTLTQPGKTNAVLKIELDGTFAGSFGLIFNIGASNSVIRGLVINNFGNGLRFDGSTGHQVEGNFIGTDPEGISVEGNATGVYVSTSDGSTIGGTLPAARNLISGNLLFGVRLLSDSAGNTIQGNLIGTNKNGGPLGNDDVGVMLTSSGNGNRILFNSIYSNGGLGIDLGIADGVTPNDPDDPDTEANTLQNFPGISSAVTASGGPTTITGALNSTPNSTFTIQFFSSPAPDPSGFREGKTFIGQRSVTTNANGNAPFSFDFATAVPVSWRVTATATGVGGTSEFSRARIVVRPPISG